MPRKFCIGSLAEAARDFIDLLAMAGQSYWQILPLNPTGCGDSPYCCFSAFAGNPYFIDLDLLVEEGLLKNSEVNSVNFGTDPRRVDYGKLYDKRFGLLKLAAERGRGNAEFDLFKKENVWLQDYCSFMALKQHYNMEIWTKWEDERARLHELSIIGDDGARFKDEIDILAFIQFLFFRQWEAIKLYANSKGIKIIGDIPIYVAFDSADVWANREEFLLGPNGSPQLVSGVPPDYFSKNGQLWGNPIYDWQHMKLNGFTWWKNRLKRAELLYDIIRIDHFRGLESFWAVPYGMKTARDGFWVKGPGESFIDFVKNDFPNLEFIAEDLGVITNEVRMLLDYSGFPGMNVMEFAFGGDERNPYLPINQKKNSVCYTGTHDNPPLKLWRKIACKHELEFSKKYLGLKKAEGYDWGMIRAGMNSRACIFIAQMQDYLGLTYGSRINTPGTRKGNWRWRLLEGEASAELAARIRSCTEKSGRCHT